MKAFASSPVARPLAAVLLLAMGCLVGLTLVVSTVTDWWSAVQERDAKADFLGRSVAAGRLAKVHEGAAVLTIAAESDTLAAARMDDLLRAAAVDAGGNVLSSRAEAKTDEPGPRLRIETQAVVEGRIEALQALLYRLETGAPLVLVDDFRLEPAPSAAATADPRAPLLRATMTLSAFRESRKP